MHARWRLPSFIQEVRKQQLTSSEYIFAGEVVETHQPRRDSISIAGLMLTGRTGSGRHYFRIIDGETALLGAR